VPGLASTASASLNAALRRAILAAAGSAQLRRLVDRYGMRLGASRFVAGRTLDECIDVLASLNAKGLKANTTILGEGVAEEVEAAAVAAEYAQILERVTERGLRANLAVKLTHLGLEIDEELAFEHVAGVVDRAAELGTSVRIDMEQSAFVDATLGVYCRLRERGRDNVGAVLQAYLRRSEDDLRALLPLQPNLRIVKGAYLEPPEVAYPRKEDVDAAYARLVEAALGGGAYVAIATHDEHLIERSLAFAEREGLGRDRFELQMLYGVRPQLQLELVRRGYVVLVATPFGPDWYPYLMRRLAERPANLIFVLRNLVRG
jgi:proline dehydrogenase